ncbi:telomere-protecting terminal protein Tpg [Streptomyces sp. HO565]|uniref:telomere-protecting terminal protein Tpg n=1 Tax=Streptomyces sp. HO565 TaxID=2857489 RepID=UPI0038B46632
MKDQIRRPRVNLAQRLEDAVRARWQPRLRAQARRQAATSTTLVLDTRARFGFTAAPGTTDDARIRHFTLALPPHHAARLFDAHDKAPENNSGAPSRPKPLGEGLLPRRRPPRHRPGGRVHGRRTRGARPVGAHPPRAEHHADIFERESGSRCRLSPRCLEKLAAYHDRVRPRTVGWRTRCRPRRGWPR